MNLKGIFGGDHIYSEQLINAFLENHKAVDIQKQAGIGKTKYYRLTNDPEFQAILQERRDAVVKAAVQQMGNRFSHNLYILQEIIDDPEASKQVRINALNLYLSQFGAWKERTELIDRISRLEESTREM